MIISRKDPINFASTTLVEKLGLPLIPMDRPYLWISEFGEVEVSHRVVVCFSNVVPMSNTHIYHWAMTRNPLRFEIQVNPKQRTEPQEPRI